MCAVLEESDGEEVWGHCHAYWPDRGEAGIYIYIYSYAIDTHSVHVSLYYVIVLIYGRVHVCLLRRCAVSTGPVWQR